MTISPLGLDTAAVRRQDDIPVPRAVLIQLIEAAGGIFSFDAYDVVAGREDVELVFETQKDPWRTILRVVPA